MVAGGLCCSLTCMAEEPHYLQTVSSLLGITPPTPGMSCLERILLRSACCAVRPPRTTDRCATNVGARVCWLTRESPGVSASEANTFVQRERPRERKKQTVIVPT
ncbi:unnamed protein product, partial [Ectocarpus sp. 8 AP-2014]